MPIAFPAKIVKTVTGAVVNNTDPANPVVMAGDALIANPLSQFALTTSAELFSVISNPTGSEQLVYSSNATMLGLTIKNSSGAEAVVFDVIGTNPVIHGNDVAGTPFDTIGFDINGKALVTGDLTVTGAIAGSNLSGVNTGDQDLSGKLSTTGPMEGLTLTDTVTGTVYKSRMTDGVQFWDAQP